MKTQRLEIRPVVESDGQDFRDIWADFSKSDYAQYDIPHDTEDSLVRARIARWAKASGAHRFFAVCLHEKVIGYISFNQREKGYEIGYCFHSAAQGKGYAKESLSALIEAMRQEGVTHFSAGTALLNTPSVCLLKSVGFELTGTEKVSFYQDESGKDIVFDGGIFELNLPI